jgi:hypothetical protein
MEYPERRMTKSFRWLIPAMALPLAALMAAAATSGSDAPSAKVRQDLSGTWAMPEEGVYRSYSACCDGPGTETPFTPKYRKIRDAFAKLPENVPEKTVNNVSHCISAGVPGTFEHTLLFEFLLTPGRVNLIFADGSFRRIWTDGRSFPTALTPLIQGNSIGHWEGKTLVVETRGISSKSDIFVEGPIKATAKTKVTERITVESDKTLRMHTVVEDTEIFTRPYSYDTTFLKVPMSFEVHCSGNNRDNSHQQVDLTPPDDDE